MNNIRFSTHQPNLSNIVPTRCHTFKTGLLATIGVLGLACLAGIANLYSKQPLVPPPLQEWCPPKPLPFKQLCEATAINNLSQAKINRLNWTQTLSAQPPQPERREVDCSKAQEWVNNHVGEHSQSLARDFVKNIQYIPQENFEEALRCSVADFNLQLNGEPYIALGSYTHKSEFWVASLALKHLKLLPADVTSYFHLNRENSLDKVLAKHSKVRQVVIFDDGIYSGSQMTEALNLIYGVMQAKFSDGNYTIHVVVPYMVSIDIIKGRISETLEFEDQILSKIKFYQHETFTPVDKLISPAKLNDFYKLYPSNAGISLGKKSLIVFDHKIPDFFSNYESAFSGWPGKDIRSWWDKLSDRIRGVTHKCEKENAIECLTPFVSQGIPPYRSEYLLHD